MNWILLSFLLLPLTLQARCLCIVKSEDTTLYKKSVVREYACKRILKNIVIHNSSRRGFCKSAQSKINLKWGCFDLTESFTPRKTTVFQCKELTPLIDARDLAISTANTALFLENSEKYLKTTPPLPEDCMPDKQQLSPKSDRESHELKIDITLSPKEIDKLISHQYPGKVFDDFKSNSLVFELGNDNFLYGLPVLLGLHKFGYEDGDDTGLTHTQYLRINKKIDGNFILSLEFKGRLFTSDILPGEISESQLKAFNLSSEDEETILNGNETDLENKKINQFFLEESIQKLLITKIKNNTNTRITLAVGRHRIETQKNENNFFLSPLRQQEFWHDTINVVDKNLVWDYNSKSQSSRSQVAAMVEVKLEDKIALGSDQTSRYEIDYSLEGRYTGIDDASFLKAEIGPSLYFQKSPEALAYRLGASVSTQYFETSERFNSAKVHISAAGERHLIGLEITKHLSDEPKYLQVHPLFYESPDNEDIEEFKNKSDDLLYNIIYQYKF